jgi:[ribosomal protein S5]-alanine N-acetyltransferase
VGRAGLRHLDVEGVPEVEIACALFPEFWGQGLATDAVRACVTIGRDWLGFPSVVALTLPANLASQRVLRKAALVREREVLHGGVGHLLFRSD